MKWQSSVQVFIDPYIKQNNKDLVEKAEFLGHTAGYVISSNISELRPLLTAKVIIFEQENSQNKALLEDKNNILVQLDQPNLDLFSTQELIEEAFTTCDEEELEHHFEMIKIFLENKLKDIEAEVLTLGQKKINNLIEKKNNQNFLNIQLTDNFQHFEQQIFEFYSLSEIIEFFNSEKQDVFEVEMNIKTLGEILFEKTESEFTSVFKTSDTKLFLCWKKDQKNHLEVLAAYDLLIRCFQNHAIVSSSIQKRELWEARLSQFDLPIVIFDESSEVMIHNRHFIDLNLSSKQCFAYEHNEQITLGRNIYRVIKNFEMEPYLQVIFIPVNEFLIQKERPSFEELGIISSSIAHELNNPLAGISAALDVLLLDELSYETTSELKEMKNVVYRCRNLVAIFLGFSQVKNLKEKQVSLNLSLESLFDQALELIRFRLIENNMTLKIDFKKHSEFQGAFDSSVLAMMMYLLMGEIVTNFSHHNLVAGEQKKKINLKITEDKESFEIHFPMGINLGQSFYNSKLVSHLFEVLYLKVEVESSVIKFSL